MAETTKDYLIALAQYLAAQAGWTWNVNGIYTAVQTGIFLKDVPIHPDRIVVLAAYHDMEEVLTPTRELDFQIRVRGGQIPTECDDLAETAFKLLHKKHHLVWNGLEITRIRHLSFASLGPDSASRWERSDNYELLTQRRA